MKKNKVKQIFAVDLFCGVGGLTNGLEKVGIKVIKGYDIDPSVEHAYSKNNKAKFQLQDINKLKGSEIIKLFKQKKASKTLIAGCAPCQPFSAYQKKKNIKLAQKHKRYPVFKKFIQIVEEVNPDFVTMENVPRIQKDINFIGLVDSLKNKMKYHVTYKTINIAHYGAPQMRRRLVLVASKIDQIKFPSQKKEKIITLKEAIGHLPKIKHGTFHKSDPLHKSCKLSSKNLARIKKSKPGGTWKDWPQNLLPDCYKKPTGKTFTSVYGRLQADKPANTLTTQFTRYGTGRYGHYEQDRALSLREGSIIQTFPKTYDFNSEKLGITKIAQQIGNALPPIIGEIIGKLLNHQIKKNIKK